ARLLLLPCRIAEISSGAERLALGGEDRAADFDVTVELLQRIGDLVDQGDVKEIERRSPDLDQADLVVLLNADIRKPAHGVLFKSAQTEPARYDAAEHFGRAALDRQFGRGLDCKRQLPFQRLAISRVLLDKSGEVAHPVRQLLLPDGANVLDD